MAISDQQFADWLASPDLIACTLVDVQVRSNGVELTRYVSTVPYTTYNGSLQYEPIISVGIKYTEQISLTGSAGLSVGDLELINQDGALDSWLNDVWVNRPIVARIGDPRWDISDFRLIFNGICSGVDSKNSDRINITIMDKLQRLNTPVSEHILGGTTPNKNSLIPIVLGEVHNITPLLTNDAIEEYQVNDGPTERLIEARDNGVIIPVVMDVTTGKFNLIAQLKGILTCSVQGAKSPNYVNSVAGIIKLLVTQYGNVLNRFTDSDIDLANFSAFDASNQQAVGHFLNSRENILNVCQVLANSLGAQILMSREGKLRLIQLNLPTSPSFSITQDDIIENSLSISSTIAVEASVKLGFCKNWTLEDKLETGIIPEHAALYAQEWITVTKTDETVKSIYKLDSEPIQIDTALLDITDAENEAQRRLVFDSAQKTVYRMQGYPRLLQLSLGQSITIYNNRYGMKDGKIGKVISLSPNWATLRVDVEVLV